MKDGWPLSNAKFNPNGEFNLSHSPSNLDIGVSPDEDYMKAFKESIESLALEEFSLAVIVHGVDVYEGDILESSDGIKLSEGQVLERDLYIWDKLSALNLPQAWCMGGGYGPKIQNLYIQFFENRLKK